LGRRCRSFGTGTERATPASVSAKELAVRARGTQGAHSAYIDIELAAEAVRGYRATYSGSNDSYDTDSSADVEQEHLSVPSQCRH
jgi:hypothetical protein